MSGTRVRSTEWNDPVHQCAVPSIPGQLSLDSPCGPPSGQCRSCTLVIMSQREDVRIYLLRFYFLFSSQKFVFPVNHYWMLSFLSLKLCSTVSLFLSVLFFFFGAVILCACMQACVCMCVCVCVCVRARARTCVCASGRVGIVCVNIDDSTHSCRIPAQRFLYFVFL